MEQIQWLKCGGGVWCELNKVDPSHKNLKGLKGVYIVWNEQPEKIVVRIGYGSISDELTHLRKDTAVQAFSKFPLFVTWADAEEFNMKHICSYLTESLSPKVSAGNTGSQKLAVNMPW